MPPPPQRYYETHDTEYVRRFAAGHVGWDPGPFDGFFMRSFVEASLKQSGLEGKGRRALELGCGTGALACLLAQRDFAVVAVDVAPSAIAFARRAASERSLRIAFEVSDVCRDELPAGPFDLIVDSHLLHCIVFPSERQQLLQKIRSRMGVGGEFWTETMVLTAGQAPNPQWQRDDNGILWVNQPHDKNIVGARWIDGVWRFPLRYIAPSADALCAELNEAGLRIVAWETYPPVESGAPGGFRARCAVDEV